MRCLTIVALLLTVTSATYCGPGPLVTAEPTAPPPEDGGLEHKPTATEAPTLTPTTVDTMIPAPTPSQEPTPEGPLLRMVIIRARSSREVKQLRQMDLVDIVRVRPDPSRPPSEESLSGGFIVEAVVTPGILAKLKAMGFEITEFPPPEK